MKSVSYEKLRRKLMAPAKEDRKRKLKPIYFRGFDWTEMGKIYDLTIGSDDAIWAQVLKQRLWASAMVAAGHEKGDYTLAKWQIRQARRYTMAVSESDCHNDSKVFAAIAMIPDDETFVKWITTFLECAWT